MTSSAVGVVPTPAVLGCSSNRPGNRPRDELSNSDRCYPSDRESYGQSFEENNRDYYSGASPNSCRGPGRVLVLNSSR